MLYEHDVGRNGIAKVKTGLKADDFNLQGQGIIEYAELLTLHIYKEDNIPYPMAEQSLADPVKQVLAEAYAQVEKSKGGEALWQQYRDFTDRLERILSAT